MRNTFDEAKTKKNKKTSKFMRVDFELWGIPCECNVLLVPLAVPVCFLAHCEKTYRDSLEWSEKKAEKLLDKRLGKVLEWDEEEKAYWFCMNWNSEYFKSKAPFGMRTWAKKYNFQVLQYLENGYHHPIYRKLTEVDKWGDKWLKFEEFRG